jgi:hypothetical protein
VAPSGAVSANVTVFKTKLTQNECAGIVIEDGTVIGLLDDIAIHGDRSNTGASNNYGLFIGSESGDYGGGGLTCGSDIAIYNCYLGIRVTTGGTLFCNYIAIGYCQSALLQCINNSNVDASYGVFNASIANGVMVYSSGFGIVSNSVIVGCAGNAAYCNNHGYGYFTNVKIIANGGLGLLSQYSGAAFCSGATIRYNGNHGIYVTLASEVNMPNGTVSNNAGAGVYAIENSVAYVAGATIQSNAGGGVYAANNAYINTSGATINSNTGFDYSPSGARPVVGNNEALIV